MKWITALDLEQWADTIPARDDFPGLVGDLVRATVDSVTSFRFPRGNKGQVRGFDGVLQADAQGPYVPDGESYWEFGVNEAGAAKATGDYEKRTKEVDAATRLDATFVFVTPRTWDNPKLKLADWVREKCDLKEWKDVRYIDGSMLEDWLAECPAVASRYAKYVLKAQPVAGVRSTDEFWDEFSTRFDPQLVDKVLLAGREDQATYIVQQLNGGPSKLLYAADAPDEVVAFAIAAIRSADPAVKLFLESRTLVVDSEEAARQLVGRKGLAFLLRGQGRDFVGLLSQHGPTVVSAGADERRMAHVQLNRPKSSALADAFVAMGYGQQEGYELARRCGRSLAVLARLIPNGNATKPGWVDSGEKLLPALLAGSWHATTKPDMEVLRTLAQVEDYDDFEFPLRKLTRLQDPPLDRAGDVWSMRASVDAFVHLGHLLGRKQLDGFKEAATTVFSKIGDPPKADDVFRSSSAREETHSSWLKDGLMTTLLHMAALHEQADFTVAGSSPTEFVNKIVRELPGLAKDHRLLAALQDQLPLLAEAAPVPFLEALEQLLEGDASGIKPIFQEFDGIVTSHSYHYGVLWALEVVAWDPALLLRSSLCLAKLAAIDPGGKDSNRPINSLRSIFLSWSPNTSAKAAERSAVLKHVVSAVPSIAWELITKLLPKAHDTSSPTQAPKFREYEEREPEVLTYGLVWESQAVVVDLAVGHVGHDPGRWHTLISAMHHFQEKPFYDVAEALRLELETPHVDTYEIWDHLRKEVNRHKAFDSTEWSLKDKPLAVLDTLVTGHAPKNPVLLASWLFDDWMPDVPGKGDLTDDPTEGIEAARATAITGLYASEGIEGLVALAGKVKLPQHVAHAVKNLQLEMEGLLRVMRAGLQNEALDLFSTIVMAEAISRFKRDGEDAVRVELHGLGLSPDRTSQLLMGLPETKETWDFVATFGEETEDSYWRGKHSFFVTGPVEELMLAIENYTRRGRYLAVLDASSRRLHDLPTKLLMELLNRAIPEINAMQGARGTMTLYVVERAFDELRTREDEPLEDIAQLEFAYLPALRERKKLLVLHRMIAEEASLFVDVIVAVFKPENSESVPVDDAARRKAVAAYELLQGLKTLPGQTGDEIDAQKLLSWCLEVRELATKADRLTMAEQRVGHLFARAPASSVDGAWPHDAVRLVIETLASDRLERGIEVERINMRGVYSKGIGEGGLQERDLAAQAQQWADAVPAYPRTAAMLRRVAASWSRYAERADVEAEEDELRR